MSTQCKNLVIGAGVSGLSFSYHSAYPAYVIEKESRAFGHSRSDSWCNIRWDEGPHVSFTQDEYVQQLLQSCLIDNELVSQSVEIKSLFGGRWVTHPIQNNLGDLPRSIGEKCYQEIISASNTCEDKILANDYGSWLRSNFGETLYRDFYKVYTQKYWTVDPSELGIDWLGPRVPPPSISKIEEGFLSRSKSNTNYISEIRYPLMGGFESFFRFLEGDSQIDFNKAVESIDLRGKKVICADGSAYNFENLIVTSPLPDFVSSLVDVDTDILGLSKELEYTSLLLIDIAVEHKVISPSPWIYVYDPDKSLCRVSFPGLLSARTISGPFQGAIQVEIYFSKSKPLNESIENIIARAIRELKEIGLIEDHSMPGLRVRHRTIRHANVLMTKRREEKLNPILDYLEDFGLFRYPGDSHPLPNRKIDYSQVEGSNIFLLGRYAEWKYHWTDDCIICSKNLAQAIS